MKFTKTSKTEYSATVGGKVVGKVYQDSKEQWLGLLNGMVGANEWARVSDAKANLKSNYQLAKQGHPAFASATI